MFQREKKGKGRKKKIIRKKYCRLCVEKMDEIDYRDIKTLSGFITERGKILSTKVSGNCTRHQKKLTIAIKRARICSLLPFSAE
ncbi:30S ribosomal protein S18 [bacterium]|nr:30S ribosomal protein S18 [bacterium]